MRVLVTGGTGYIGSTAVDLLLEQGYEISILDDCSTGHADTAPAGVSFIQGSLLNSGDLAQALVGVDAVMHFAGKSLVGESVEKPDLYHQVNVDGTRNLLDEMHKSGVRKLVFSSSAATYGEPEQVPILESAPIRYFNVAGALKSKRGWLAERHNPETHLIPNVLRSTKENPVKIFGTDWPTADGTCVRDYVHVVDLIDAHIKALETLTAGVHEIYNLGSGDGYSVREVVAAASKAAGHQIPTIDSPRRAGDPAVLIADINKAKSKLGWVPTRGIEDMVADTLAAFS